MVSAEVEREREGRSDTVEMVELLRTVGDELDATCGVSRGPLRALAVLPGAIAAIVGALSPGEPNEIVLFTLDALQRLAATGRAARGEATLRRPTLDISPAGYADLLRAIGLFAAENSWADLRLLSFPQGLALYHDGGHEVVLGERRLREVINGAYRRRADLEAVPEDMSLTRRAVSRPVGPCQVEPSPYTYADALAALGDRFARTDQGKDQYPLIADVADGFAVVSRAPDGQSHAYVVTAVTLAEDVRRRRGIGVRRSAPTALREGLRAVGAYLDRAHAREILVQRRPASANTPAGSFALAFTALSGSSGVVGSFDRCLVPAYIPGTPDYEVEELWGF